MGQALSVKQAVLAGQPATQVAALAWRGVEALEVLLITSRETRRWVLPKGWPIKGKPPHEAAAQEAREEAGVRGAIAKQPIGSYRYVKFLKDGAGVDCVVSVYPLTVARQRKRWPEQNQRAARWFSPEEAATAVAEPELRSLILNFASRWRAGKVAPAAVNRR